MSAWDRQQGLLDSIGSWKADSAGRLSRPLVRRPTERTGLVSPLSRWKACAPAAIVVQPLRRESRTSARRCLRLQRSDLASLGGGDGRWRRSQCCCPRRRSARAVWKTSGSPLASGLELAAPQLSPASHRERVGAGHGDRRRSCWKADSPAALALLEAGFLLRWAGRFIPPWPTLGGHPGACSIGWYLPKEAPMRQPLPAAGDWTSPQLGEEKSWTRACASRSRSFAME